MRKAFAFLTSSLSSVNKFSSEETKASSPNIQKENNKSQPITSNTKNEKLSQNKHNTDETPTKINNNNIKLKKKNSNDFKNLDSKKSVPQSKKQGLLRKTSITTPSTTVTTSHSPSNKLPVIKNSDSESDSKSETNGDNEEEEKDDDDDVPLGLRLKRSQSTSSNYPPPSSRRNQEYYNDDTRLRNVSGMLLQHSRSTTDSNMGRYHYHYSPRHLSQCSPVPTTPPLIHTSHQPRPHYFGERRFSSSASSSSSASADSNGNRYYRNSNNSRNNRYSTYSLPYWNEYEYDYVHNHYDDELYDDYYEHRIIGNSNGDISVPNTPTLPSPIERMRRDSLNNLSPRSRNNSFSTSRSTERSNDSNCLVAGANPPPPNKYQKEATKKMTTAEYHRYQQEMVTAQYLKHGINPVIGESIPMNSEPLSRMGPTLMQVQSLMIGTVNVPSSRPKRFSVIDRGYSGYSGSYSSSGSNTPPLTGLARRTSYTKTTSGSGVGNGGGNEINDLSDHRRTHSESNISQQQISPRSSTRHHHHYHDTPLHLQHHHSATSLSSSGSTYVSSSGSGGPPTPTSRSSSMFGPNVNGSRPSTPSSIGSGYIFDKEKRKRRISEKGEYFEKYRHNK